MLDIPPSAGAPTALSPRTPPRDRVAPPVRATAALILLTAVAGCGTAGPPSPGPAPTSSQETGRSLEAELRQLTEGFRGRAGVYARNLATGEEVAIAADEIYPTASMVKVPLLVGLWQAVDAGRLELDARLTYDDSLFYGGEGDVVNKLRPGEEVSIETLAIQMIVRSDNTASLWIQGLVGGATVNDWLAEHGFEHTRVNSRVEGRRDDWEVYGWGQSTPREMARLLTMIRNGEVVSGAASDWMYRLLSRSWWPDGATGQIPATVNVAAKPGAVSAARSEVLVVNTPGGDYVLCVMTREQEDTSWTYENEGDELVRAVSAAVWDRWGTS